VTLRARYRPLMEPCAKARAISNGSGGGEGRARAGEWRCRKGEEGEAARAERLGSRLRIERSKAVWCVGHE